MASRRAGRDRRPELDAVRLDRRQPDADLVRCTAAAASTAGFLSHNWSPARIFMGDAGSALLGFLLATVPWVIGGRIGCWLPTVLVLWPFLFDTLFTTRCVVRCVGSGSGRRTGRICTSA